MSKGKKIYFLVLILITILVTTFYFSYAIFSNTQEEHGKLNIVAGTLNYKVKGEDIYNNQIEVTKNTTRTITLTVTSLNEIDSKYELYYKIDSNKNVEVGYDSNTKDSVKGIIRKNDSKEITVIIRNNSSNKITVTFGVHGGLANLEYDDIKEYGLALNELKLNDVVIAWNYIGNKTKPTSFPKKNSGYSVESVSCTNADGSFNNSSWKLEVTNISGVTATCTLTFTDTYRETLLNGTDPVITDKLIPVVISDTGVVTKADTSKEWYSYENKKWANSVILKDESITYQDGEEIQESNIESYFVWIPRYKYKIFNTGSYTGLTTISNSTQTIEVVFENKDTTTSNGTTVGSYLTHPAFTSLDVNGIWVGKFETGYDGATSTAGAQVNSVDTSKIIIKPNVYSWRNITTGNMFKNSYDYKRDLDSHMMKNTEWGSVAYLQHSQYGSQVNIRINNNSAFITGYAGKGEPTVGYNIGTSIAGNRVESTDLGKDGTYTVNYLNTNSTVASTTNNYSGIYDMSGGAWEYVMGYTTGATTVGGTSGITSLYPNFFRNSSYSKYWDKYTSTINTNFNNRILGDATGEMGPFGNEKDPDTGIRYRSSWYKGYAIFANSSGPWIERGGSWHHGNASGIFTFGTTPGGTYINDSFRIVLAPKNS